MTTATLQPGSFIWVDGIPVAWQTTDTEILRLLGQLTTTPTPGTSLSEAMSRLTGGENNKNTVTPTAPSEPASTRTSSTSPPTSSSASTPSSTLSTSLSVFRSTQETNSEESSRDSSTSTRFTTSAARWTSGPLLVGDCATPAWTLLEVSTAYLYAPVIGCGYDKLSCCPSAAEPLTGTEDTGPFPTARVPWCPDDYVTISSSGCCPS